jgi:SAM-dependent methyltransferase
MTDSRYSSPAAPGLSDWFAGDAGRYVLAWETAAMDTAVADIFGYYALQVGLPQTNFLRANRMPSRFVLDEAVFAALPPVPHLRASAYELPFASQSLDLVVLPHVLEFADEPHDILREVERVLRPEGQLIVTGFNPFSLWGIRRSYDPQAALPWNSEFISLFRMKDWLKLLNFDLARGQFGCYRPPFTSEKWLNRLGSLETLGPRWWPIAGGVYLLQAVKRVQGMRLIGPKWQRQRVRATVVRPATQSSHHSQPHQ